MSVRDREAYRRAKLLARRVDHSYDPLSTSTGTRPSPRATGASAQHRSSLYGTALWHDLTEEQRTS